MDEAGRAIWPDESGHVERDGVRVWWERYGDGEPTIFFLPTWSLIHSRSWKAQIHYFARHFRVLTMDGRGNGRSDRPDPAAAYNPLEFAADALAVLDASGTDSAVLVSTSLGTLWNLILAAGSPHRVLASVFLGPTTYEAGPPHPDWAHTPFHERLDSHEDGRRYNRHFMREHYEDFCRWWIGLVMSEPHSTRQVEFALEMCACTDGEVAAKTLEGVGMDQAATVAESMRAGSAPLRMMAEQVRCPVLVVNGALEEIALQHQAEALARDTGGELLIVPDASHAPQARKPVVFNLALREFVERAATSAASR